MKLNFYEAHYFFNIFSKSKSSFSEWLKSKPQGKVKIFGEWQDDGMYQIDEADDNADFKAWHKSKREADKKRQEEHRRKSLATKTGLARARANRNRECVQCLKSSAKKGKQIK